LNAAKAATTFWSHVFHNVVAGFSPRFPLEEVLQRELHDSRIPGVRITPNVLPLTAVARAVGVLASAGSFQDVECLGPNSTLRFTETKYP